MARKFRIGDIVEVVKQVGIVPLKVEFGKRCRGVVTDYCNGEEYPYIVRRLKTGRESDFNACELKLIRRGK